MIYDEILNKIKEYNTIIIHGHIRPDGDCLGSQLGLRQSLRLTFPEKDIYADQGETEIQKEQLDSGSLRRSGNRRIYDLDTDLLSIFRK